MRYTEIAIAKPFSGCPKINLAELFGASPKKPVILRIPVTGERPIKLKAENLPEGLMLEDNVIRGSVDKAGEYKAIITAENSLGTDEKELTIEIKEDGVLLTPLMGFTTWNAFGYEVTQDKVEKVAEKIEALGLTEYGYSYINIDSGWQGEYGGRFDAIMPNEKFPDMKGFCDRLHKKGYKCGIYSSPMLYSFGCNMNHKPLPPGCTQGEPDDRFSDLRGGIGVIRKEENNARQWAEWGFDYLKYDWRPCDPYNADIMKKALASTHRDFGFCVTVRANVDYHTYWSKYCSSYRCNPDSNGTWENFRELIKSYYDFIAYINKGHFFDLDMLDTGYSEFFAGLGYYENPDFGYTEDEQLAVFSARAFFSSPIQISTNFENINEFELSMYCNEEVIAINQDSKFSAAKPYMILEDGKKIIHVYKKMLSNGDYALCIFNLGETKEVVKVYLDGPSKIRDVWGKCDNEDGALLHKVMHPHTVRMFRITSL